MQSMVSYVFPVISCILFLSLLTDCAYIARTDHPEQAGTYTHEIEPWDGKNYRVAYETTQGLVKVEKGFLENDKDGQPALVVLGFYTYVGESDRIYVREYYSDTTGYNPKPEYLLSSESEKQRIRRMIELIRMIRAAKDLVDIQLMTKILGNLLKEDIIIARLEAEQKAKSKQ